MKLNCQKNFDKMATLRPRLNPLTFVFLLCFTGKTDQNGSAVITVREDSDVVLPCSLATRENIELKLFDWIKRATENDGQKEVFFYDAGIHYNSGRSGQSEQFKGRVSHFPEKLKHGDASIIIRNTKVADSGNYTCVFPLLQPRQTFHTELVVERELRDRTTENILGPKVVIAQQDGEAVLPCSLSTEENIELKLFDWTKTAPSDADRREVFLYDAGIHYNNGRPGQSDEFKGRVSHFPEELTHGNASIIITNTKMTDSGEYTCVFPRLQPRQTFHIKLVVGAASKPSVTTRKAKYGVLLRCEVEGDPRPTVEWQDSAGNKLPAGETQVSKRGGRVYYTLNATVTRSDIFRCVATQKTLGHQIYTETHVSVNEPPIINVYEGRDVSLPCSLDTKANIESELFEWRKDGQKEVFMFDGGKHSRNGHGSQSEEFKGRVAYFPKKLKHGDASITITNTKMSDRGNYTCEFPNLQPRQTFHIELVVVDIGETEIGDESESTPGWIIAVSVLCIVGVGVVLLLVLMFFGCITCGRNKGSPVPQS